MAIGTGHEPRRPARIKDVADLAGVSWKTVSNVVNDRAVVRPETRERVLAAIESLGYRPSLAARSLQSGRSRILTLAVPDLTNPYFASLAHSIIAEAATRGYTVLTDVTGGDREHERRVAAGYPSLLHDGIIFSPLALGVDEVLALHDDTPLVFLGERISASGVDHVAIDNVASAREVTGHLLGLGHRRLAFVGAQTSRSGAAAMREQGFRDAIAAAGLAVADDLVLPVAGYSREDGAAAADLLLPRLGELDAVVCGNDLLAIGLLARLRALGVGVPEDVSVTGWDNTAEGAYAAPALTTVAPDEAAMARLAVAALIARLDEPEREAVAHVVEHRLVVRNSSAPRR